MNGLYMLGAGAWTLGLASAHWFVYRPYLNRWEASRETPLA